MDLALSLGLGLESAVLSAADTTRPIDVVVTGTPEHPEMLIVLTPGTALVRSQLQGRYRFTPVAGLGERLDPRSPRAREGEVLRCALVGVAGPTATRIVCGRTNAALDHAGRYAAFVSQRRENEQIDAVVDIRGDAVRRALVPYAREVLDDLAREWGRSAAEERRTRGREPDFGDPEAVVSMVSELARGLEAYGADLREARASAEVSAQQVTTEARLVLAPEGRSALARDAAARVDAPRDHPLAGRLAPDSFFVIDSRSDVAARVAAINNAVDQWVRVLGARVPDQDAARADVQALFANVGNELAAGLVRETSSNAVEATLLFNTTDGGAGARAALVRLSRAPWLRQVRFGGAPVLASYRNDALVLRMGTPPRRPVATPPRAGATPNGAPGQPNFPGGATAPMPPSTVLIGLAGDTLVIIAGQRPEISFAALRARASGPLPAPIARAEPAPLVIGLVPSALGRESGEASEPIVATYRVEREGGSLVGRARIAVPARSIEALRTAMQGPPDPYASGRTSPAPGGRR